MGIKN